MECIQPPALTELQIEMALDEGGPPAVAAHLAACPACGARAAALAADNQRLTLALFRADCPPALTLAEALELLLDGDEQAQVQRHLAGCEWCQAEVKTLTAFLAQPLIDSTLQGSTSPLAGLRRLVAQIISTPSALTGGAPLPALRGGSDEMLAFAAGDISLTLVSERESSGAIMLVGLLSRPDGALGDFQGRTVHLLRDDEPISETQVDDLNNFAFPDLTPGSYALAIPDDETVVIIPALELTLT